jgi:hypothetical protein
VANIQKKDLKVEKNESFYILGLATGTYHKNLPIPKKKIPPHA